jgi:uncharacterized tellurite resistance protein B-like protein
MAGAERSRLASWLDRAAALLSPGVGRVALDDDGDLRLAVAALLVEAARMDDRFEASERQVIVDLLCRRFGLTAEEAHSSLATAEGAVEKSTQLFRFTQTIADRLDRADRSRIIEMLWEVAYADGALSPQEDALIRRIAGLVYVDDADRMAARRRVLERLGLGGLTALPAAKD